MTSYTNKENNGLLHYYIDCGKDIAQSVSTKPLTSQSYNDVRRVSGNNLTLFGIIPSFITLENKLDDYEFECYLDDLLLDIQDDGHRTLYCRFQTIRRRMQNSNEYCG